MYLKILSANSGHLFRPPWYLSQLLRSPAHGDANLSSRNHFQLLQLHMVSSPSFTITLQLFFSFFFHIFHIKTMICNVWSFNVWIIWLVVYYYFSGIYFCTENKFLNLELPELMYYLNWCWLIIKKSLPLPNAITQPISQASCMSCSSHLSPKIDGWREIREYLTCATCLTAAPTSR